MLAQAKLKQYMTKELLADQDDIDIQEDDNLLLSGLIDSLGIMRLITFIEQEFQVKVQPEDVTIENFSTIKIISDYLARHGAQ
ncbi:MAG: acyl carrier protein [Desulfobacterales bacterium]|jgi:acyl carrier protein